MLISSNRPFSELSVGQAFLRWRKEQGFVKHYQNEDAGHWELMFRAFQAGYVFGVNQTAPLSRATESNQ